MSEFIKIGTLVRVQDAITLKYLGNSVAGSFVWATRIERYCDRLAMICGVDTTLNTYTLYFPHEDREVKHWKPEEFTVLSDLLHLYRPDDKQ